MLNKKAQSEDAFEYILVAVVIVVGIIVLTLGHNFKEFSVHQAMNSLSPDVTEIQSYDSSFIATDLENVLDLQVSNEYTFAELISHMPDNYPEIKDSTLSNLLIQENTVTVDKLYCSQQLFNFLNSQLEPVYYSNWFISVYHDSQLIFFCSPISNVFTSTESAANMPLPSLDPKVNLNVRLEVYQ